MLTLFRSFFQPAMDAPSPSHQAVRTRILPVDASNLSDSEFPGQSVKKLHDWELSLKDSPDASNLTDAVERLRTTNIPVAFPTETVYGLGADATRSAAVRGIYKAKQRPSDNPLIVHVCSCNQLRALLEPQAHRPGQKARNYDNVWSLDPEGEASSRRRPLLLREIPVVCLQDPIPVIYQLLIQKLWPGPLTIILPNPRDSVLAREVTGGRDTFAARMPDNRLALALIKLAGVPLAAPSANASTKPSPTTAEHVKEDLDGRIEVILDGGPCAVGVESTVVDGLCDPPCVLRPGGIPIEVLRGFPGWEDVIVAYKDQAQQDSAPRAPGMKYRHYSPRAKVVLYEYSAAPPSWEDLRKHLDHEGGLGIIRTARWDIQHMSNQASSASETVDGGDDSSIPTSSVPSSRSPFQITQKSSEQLYEAELSTFYRTIRPADPNLTCPLKSSLPTSKSLIPTLIPLPATPFDPPRPATNIFELCLGSSAKEIARGIFGALRELDRRGVAVILVEGIRDTEEDLAAAVMNRLRKAATVIHQGDEGSEVAEEDHHDDDDDDDNEGGDVDEEEMRLFLKARDMALGQLERACKEWRPRPDMDLEESSSGSSSSLGSEDSE